MSHRPTPRGTPRIVPRRPVDASSPCDHWRCYIVVLKMSLDAHAAHPGPFTVDDLLPYRTAREPPCQTEARSRRTIMRKARSKKQRPLLLAELERRYRETPDF